MGDTALKRAISLEFARHPKEQPFVLHVPDLSLRLSPWLDTGTPEQRFCVTVTMETWMSLLWCGWRHP